MCVVETDHRRVSPRESARIARRSAAREDTTACWKLSVAVYRPALKRARWRLLAPIPSCMSAGQNPSDSGGLRTLSALVFRGGDASRLTSAKEMV